MSRYPHPYAFDPCYGYSLDTLLQIDCPRPPGDFAEFWTSRYRRIRALAPSAEMLPSDWHDPRFEVFDLRYRSSDGLSIGGWLTVPRRGSVRRGFVVGHGYGGRDGPDLDLPFEEAVLLFPCFRGISRSRCPGIPESPDQHVLCGIDDPRHYVLGGCVDDVWMAVSALQQLFPEAAERIGYLGISFGGGIGALALPWDRRIRRAHLNIPTFGHHPLRLQLPTVGSGEAVRRHQARHGNVMATLVYYDAASAAGFVDAPTHVAAALFDPAVAPPGQFAIYNCLGGPKQLFVLDAGHFDYPNSARQRRELLADLESFFMPL
jgi:cephalosporin-C deacetylase